MITIIDYGIGNLRSIEKAFQAVGADVLRTDDPDEIAKAEHLVLPGVGAFGACIREIRGREVEDAMREVINRGVPFLGVCVGMQLLFDEGLEHGTHRGLGLLPGQVVHFHKAMNGSGEAGGAADLKVPHMGWNVLRPTRSSPLFDGLDEGGEPFVYFVHSYHAVADNESDVLATSEYGHAFPAVVQRDNVFGVQFHPEKSQYHGLRILENFADM
jgi:glutamine amidotransferase